MTQTGDGGEWGAWFRARAGDLATHASGLLDELDRALAEDGAWERLKRFLRDERAEAGAVDPWRVEVALQRLTDPRRADLPSHPLWAAEVPRHGLDEPDVHLRAWTLVRSLLEAYRDGRELALEVDGLAEVRWFLTGEAPELADAAQRRNRLALGEAVYDSLAPLGLLAPEALQHRRQDLQRWRETRVDGPASEADDRLVRHFMTVWEHQRPLVGDALALAQRALLEPASRGQHERDARAFVAERFYDTPEAHPVAALAQWCGRAHAVGLIGGGGLTGLELDGYRDSVASQLADALGPLLAGQPLWLGSNPVGFIVWRAAAVLLRDCLQAGRRQPAVRVVAALAETGSWTRVRTKELLRVCRLLQRRGADTSPWAERFGAGLRRELSLRLVSRLALTTCRKRRRAPSRLWQKTLRAYARLGPDQPEVDYLRRWWAPRPADEALDGNAAELLELSRRLAGEEWSSDTDLLDPRREAAAAARWWRAHDQAALLALEAEASATSANNGQRSPFVDIPGALRASLAPDPPRPLSPSAAGSPGLSLHVDYRFDRYGEALVELILFAAGGGRLATRLTSSYYERPVAQTEALAALGGHLSGLRRQAREGRLGGAEARASLSQVRQALADLAPAPFWAALGQALAEARALELDVDVDFGVPWEIAVVGPEDQALALVCAVTRSRRLAPGAPAPRNRLDDLLVLYDPSHPGVDEEVAVVVATWEAARPQGRAVVVGQRRELEALPSLAFDAIHYAGHRTVGLDGAPALQLGGGPLPFAQLVARTYRRPPALLVLNACTTLAASETLGSPPGTSGAHLVYGSLEPVRQSSVPTVIGTLWDIQPPPGSALFGRFYTELLAGSTPGQALLSARRAVAASPAWHGCWEAYTMLTAPAGGGEGEAR